MKLYEFANNHMIAQILHTCKDVLGIKELPPIKFIDKPYLQGGEKKSFGVFDGQGIQVIVKDRHPMDIMRTLSHELVHWKQRLEGQELDGEDGSDTENEANAMAGVIMRRFGEKYPEYFSKHGA